MGIAAFVQGIVNRLQDLMAGDIRIEMHSSERVAVIFSRPERDVARLNIEFGPCVPPPGRVRPLVGPFSQEDVTQQQIESLFDVLVSDPAAQPWDRITEAGAGKLAVFSAAFVDALVAVNRLVLDRDDQVRVKGRPLTEEQATWVLEPHNPVSDAWLQRSTWPTDTTAYGLGATLGYWGAEARGSREKGQRLYSWFGPGVPLKTMTFKRVPGEVEQLVRTK
jgi:hypothetical protein